MKKINLISTIATILVFICSCKAQQIQQSNLSNEILGTWVSNDDDLWKIVFTSNGVRKDYYENELTETYTYSITNTCNNQTLQSETFLKTTTEGFSEKSCDILNGFHTDNSGEITMSITSERGKLYLFTKE